MHAIFIASIDRGFASAPIAGGEMTMESAARLDARAQALPLSAEAARP